MRLECYENIVLHFKDEKSRLKVTEKSKQVSIKC